MGNVLKPILKAGTIIAGIAVNVIPGLGQIASTAILGTTIGTLASVAGLATGLGVVGSLLEGNKPDLAQTAQDLTTGLTISAEAKEIFAFGETFYAMQGVYVEQFGSEDQSVLYIAHHASHRVESIDEYYHNDTLVTETNGDGTGDFGDGALFIRENLGTSVQSPLNFPETSWAGAFFGCAHSGWQFTPSQDKPDILTSQIRAWGKGARVYDPRRDSTVGGAGNHRTDTQVNWQYEDAGTPLGSNLALVVLRIILGEFQGNGEFQNGTLRWGIGEDPANINMADFIIAANIADELTNGKRRHHISGVLDMSGNPYDKIRTIMAHCGGWCGRGLDGRWTIRIPVDDLSVPDWIITASDLRGVPDIKYGDYDKVFNQMIGRCAPKEALGKLAPWPVVADPALQAGAGAKLQTSIDYPFYTDYERAQYAARQYLRRSNYNRVFECPISWAYYGMERFDTVRLDLPEYGYAGEVMRCDVFAKTPAAFPSVALIEENASIYDETQAVSPNPSIGQVFGFDTNTQVSVNGLGLNAVTVEGDEGQKQNAIEVSWTLPSPRVKATEIRYRRVADTQYQHGPTLARGGTLTILPGFPPRTQIRVETRHISVFEVPGPWSGQVITTGDVLLRPLSVVPEGFAPGSVGGQGNLRFTTDAGLNGATATGEFRHLDGNTYSVPTDLAVVLPVGADGDYYVMFSAQSVQDETGGGRFAALGARGSSDAFIIVREASGQWQAVDEAGATLDFTPLATDALVFAIRVSGGEVIETHSFMALLGNDGTDGADGADGAPGPDGNSYAEKLIFLRAATQPATPTGGSYDFGAGTLTPPSGGWSAGIPGGSGPVWVAITSASVVGTTGVDNTLSWSTPVKAFQDGGTGIDGQAVDIVFIRATSQPSTPAPSTGVPTGYYATAAEVPAGSGRIYGAFGKRPTSSDPYTWDAPQVLEGQDGADGSDGAPGADGQDGAPGTDGADGADGADGLSVAERFIYRRAASTPSTPTGGSFNFDTGTLNPPSGWAEFPPAGDLPLYIAAGSAQAVGQGGTDTAIGWSSARLLAQNGTATSIIHRRATSQPSTPAASSGLPNEWYDRISQVPDGDGRLWSSLGSREPTATQTTWDEPFQTDGLDGAVEYLDLDFRRDDAERFLEEFEVFLDTGGGNPSDGTGVLLFGDNAGNDETRWVSKRAFPYDPEALYVLRAAVDRVAGSSTYFAGIVGVADDGTTIINRVGGVSLSGAYWVSALSRADDNFVEQRGYFQGLTSADGGVVEYPDPRAPAALKNGTAFFKIVLLINYLSDAGQFALQRLSFGRADPDEADSLTRTLDVIQDDGSLVTPGLRQGTSTAKRIANGTVTGLAFDGSPVTFPEPFDAMEIPSVVFFGGGLTYSPSLSGSGDYVLDFSAQNLTHEGFTPRLKLRRAASSPTLRTDTGATANPGGSGLAFGIQKSQANDAFDGRYTFSGMVDVGGVLVQPPFGQAQWFGSVDIGLYFNAGSGFELAKTITINATGSAPVPFETTATFDGLGQHGAFEFAVGITDAQSTDGTAAITAFSSVTYQSVSSAAPNIPATSTEIGGVAYEAKAGVQA